MKPFSHLVRRTHLYLALFCLPWFVMYGITSFAFSHPEWFDTSGRPWTEEASWPCTVAVPETGQIPREIATELLEIAGVEANAYGAYRAGEGQINVYIIEFWKTRQLVYQMDEQQLYLRTREPIPQHVLTGMHARAGYQHDGFLNNAWAVMVDVVMIGFLLWVATGIYIWWKLPAMRGWGAVSLLAGFLSFVGFLALL